MYAKSGAVAGRRRPPTRCRASRPSTRARRARARASAATVPEQRRPARAAAAAARVDAEPVREVERPRAGPRVEQPGGRRVGDLGALHAREPVPEQVGDEQQPVGGREIRGALRGDELEDRVERLRLQARARVELVGGDRREDPVRHAVGAVVAVVDRGCRRGAPSPSTQAVVDRPRVDADAVERPGVGDAAAQPVEDAAPEPRQVPAQRPSGTSTAPLGNRCDLLEDDRGASVAVDPPRMTRPLDAPRSTAANPPISAGRPRRRRSRRGRAGRWSGRGRARSARRRPRRRARAGPRA